MSNDSGKNKYKSCKWLEHGLMFDHCNIVRDCSIINKENGGKPMLFYNYQGELFDIGKLFEIKKNHRNLMKNGTPPQECTGCNFIEDGEWVDKDYIDNLLFAHWIDCNSKCVYCAVNEDKDVKKINKHYDIYPAIEDLVEKNVIIPSGKVDFAGGEPTIYPEFEKLLSLFIRKNFKNIFVNTSGIKLSPSITEALKQGCINLTISVDAGSKEVHEKIKRVVSFDRIWQNIREYSNAQNQSENKNQICLKFLVVPNINDKEEEFEMFFDMVQNNNINSVALSLDMFWYEMHKNENNDSLAEKLFSFCAKATERKLSWQIYPWAQWLMESKLKV